MNLWVKKFLPILTTTLLVVFLSKTPVFAHPGRTASDGCHYCRTRCDYWGERWNARHCHRGRRSTEPILGVKECKADNLWAFLAPGKQECGYKFWDWITGWGVAYGVIGWIVLTNIR